MHARPVEHAHLLLLYICTIQMGCSKPPTVTQHRVPQQDPVGSSSQFAAYAPRLLSPGRVDRILMLLQLLPALFLLISIAAIVCASPLAIAPAIAFIDNVLSYMHSVFCTRRRLPALITLQRHRGKRISPQY